MATFLVWTKVRQRLLIFNAQDSGFCGLRGCVVSMSTSEMDGFEFSKNVDLRALRIALQFGYGVAKRRRLRVFNAKDSGFFGLRGRVVSMSTLEMDGFEFSRRVELI